MDDRQKVEWTLRIAMFGEFLGHGILAMQEKAKFVEMLTAMSTIQPPLANTLLFWIGVIDVIVAIIVVLKPYRIILLWGTIWAALTAIARPMSGDPIWDLIERFANIGVPLALLFLCGWPKESKEWLD